MQALINGSQYCQKSFEHVLSQKVEKIFQLLSPCAFPVQVFSHHTCQLNGDSGENTSLPSGI